jgi:RNA polymerase sigma factor (sigma-70 family)
MHADQGYSDVELVENIRRPEKMNDAIKFLYKEYYSLLENYIINNNGTKDDAADVVQETIIAFIEIVEANKFRGESSIKSFLFSITRNLWLTELRKRSSADNRNKIFEKAKDIVEQETVQHLIRREHFSTIKQLFEKLGDKCKQLLMLVYYEDMSMNDIVKVMPDYQNEQVLRNKKYKCMKQLEQMIGDNETIRTQFKNALKHAG